MGFYRQRQVNRDTLQLDPRDGERTCPLRAMCRVIAAACNVDEVKDIRDKALAVATADYDDPKKSAG
jgi:hypothetical protein